MVIEDLGGELEVGVGDGGVGVPLGLDGAQGQFAREEGQDVVVEKGAG